MKVRYSDFKRKLKVYIDEVANGRSPLHVKRSGGENVVVLSEADYESIVETFYQIRSPKNAERLQKVINQYEKGKAREQKLIEE